MKVILQSAGNPDHGQYSPPAPREVLPVQSLRHAATVCRGYIQKWDLGGGNWTGGEVFDGGVLVARVSYNGRVWQPDGKERAL